VTEASVPASPTNIPRIREGLEDLAAGLKAWRLWTMLGWNDVRQRYRRSVLGPFWITLSMGLFTILLGIIYSRLFQMDLAEYLPYVALGLIAWGFISGTIGDACMSFVENAGLIKQLRLPFSLYVLRTVWRAFIVFLHTVVLIVPIAIYFQMSFGPETLLVVPGLALVIINQIWLAIVIAVVSTRFRDIPPLVATVLQVTIFATPIMWPVSALRGATLVVELNPVHHLIELVRSPLLGDVAPLSSWLVVLGMTAVGYVLACYLLSRASRRAVYWL
jgi:ABC-type polysaccharide/polyol phosphate export permease